MKTALAIVVGALVALFVALRMRQPSTPPAASAGSWELADTDTR